MLDSYCIDCQNCRHINDFTNLRFSPPHELLAAGDLDKTALFKRWLRSSADFTQASSESCSRSSSLPSIAESFAAMSEADSDSSASSYEDVCPNTPQLTPASSRRFDIRESVAHIDQLTIVRAVSHLYNRKRSPIGDQTESLRAFGKLQTACEESYEYEINPKSTVAKHETEDILKEIHQMAIDGAYFKLSEGLFGKKHASDEILDCFSRLENAHYWRMNKKESEASQKRGLTILSPCSGLAPDAAVNEKTQKEQEHRDPCITQRQFAFQNFAEVAPKRAAWAAQTDKLSSEAHVEDVHPSSHFVKGASVFELDAVETARRATSSFRTPQANMKPKEHHDGLSMWECDMINGTLTREEMEALNTHFNQSTRKRSRTPSPTAPQSYSERLPEAANLKSSHHKHTYSPKNAAKERKPTSYGHTHLQAEQPDRAFNTGIALRDGPSTPSPTRIYSKPRTKGTASCNKQLFLQEGSSPRSIIKNGTSSRSDASSHAPSSGNPAAPKPHTAPGMSPSKPRYSGVAPFLMDENVPYLASPQVRRSNSTEFPIEDSEVLRLSDDGNVGEMLFTPNMDRLDARDDSLQALKANFGAQIAQKDSRIAQNEHMITLQEHAISNLGQIIVELRTMLSGSKDSSRCAHSIPSGNATVARSRSDVTSYRGYGGKSVKFVEPTKHAKAALANQFAYSNGSSKESSGNSPSRVILKPKTIGKAQHTAVGDEHAMAQCGISNFEAVKGGRQLLNSDVFDVDDSEARYRV